MARFGERPAKIDLPAFERLCDEAMPFCEVYGFKVEAIGYGTARARLPAADKHLRPGGSLTGPSQMALADFTLYAALLGAIGEVPLAVTTSLTINFLRRPALADLVADCRLIKLGRRLAVGEVFIHSTDPAADPDEPVAHVTATYSIPPIS